MELVPKRVTAHRVPFSGIEFVDKVGFDLFVALVETAPDLVGELHLPTATGVKTIKARDMVWLNSRGRVEETVIVMHTDTFGIKSAKGKSILEMDV